LDTPSAVAEQNVSWLVDVVGICSFIGVFGLSMRSC